jgi:hypothetical protein
MQNTEINRPDFFFRPSKSEWERLLNRVVESTPFRRSSRLRDFLIYVGNEVVLNGEEDLHEQQIGAAVFGRPSQYDTSQDNIVRVNAMELRKRIESYFANEGQNEPLVFEIPRGSYSPIFRLRRELPVDAAKQSYLPEANIASSSIEEPAPPVLDKPFTPSGRRNLPQIALIIALICLMAWLATSIWHDQQAQMNLHKWQSGSALRAFWGNFYGKKLAPEIVLGDTSFEIIQEVLHKQFSLTDYLDYSYRTAQSSESLPSAAREKEQKDLSTILGQSTGSIGDFRVARRIAELETGEYGSRLLAAREYSGHRLRWNNTIFVGSNRSNPWIELFADRAVYHFKQAPNLAPSAVIIDKPTGTEQAQYALSPDPGMSTAYCVIVFLPNPTNTGNTLILDGTDSQATEAGGDFLTSEENLEKLQALLHQKDFPYFQLLLRISRSNGTPLGSEIVSYRVVRK